LDPRHAMAHYNLAQVVLDPKDAVRLLRRAVEIEPKYAKAHHHLGRALYRAGEYEPSIASLEKAVALGNPKDAWHGFYLAMANARLGRRDEAKKHFDEAAAWQAKQQPRDPSLRRLREEAAAVLEEGDSTGDASDEVAELLRRLGVERA